MSLGGARNDGGGAFLLDNAIDNLDRANMVVAVAAGNEGPGYFTVHYPGAAPRALTAGASTVGHGIINIVDGRRRRLRGRRRRLRGARRATSPRRSRSWPIPTARSRTGSTRLRRRPAAARPDRQDRAARPRHLRLHREDAQRPERRAVGVIMVNRDAGEAPFVMSHNGLEARPTIPGVMVSLEDGAAIDDHDGEPATLEALGVYVSARRTPT